MGAGGKVIASDILQIDALPGVEFVLGDFREESVVQQILELALEMAGRVLKPGGGALIKVFQGAGFQAQARRFARAERRDVLAGGWPAIGVA